MDSFLLPFFIWWKIIVDLVIYTYSEENSPTRISQVQVHLQLKNLLVSSPYPLNFSNSYISTLFFKTPRNLFVVILDT